MKKWNVLIATLAATLLFALTSCSSNKPCMECRSTPAQGYKNTATGEKDYYCKSCASDCAWCSDKATEHYTNGFEEITFVCKDCYRDIMELN